MKRRAASLFAAALLLAPLLSAQALAQVVPPAAPKTPQGPQFHEMDANKDGNLTLEEVLAYAKKQSAQAKAFRIADVDRDGDGVLTPEELQAAGLAGMEPFGTINVKDLDIRGDGYISKADLDEYFRRKHREAYARADQDGDGRIRKTEFALYRFSIGPQEKMQ